MLPRGMNDRSYTEMLKLEKIRELFKSVCDEQKFKLVDTPIIEFLDTFKKKDSGIENDIYTFKDKKQRDLALRFDLTMGLVRLVSSDRSLKLPQKLASFGSVFRYDEPQRLRYRQFNQWNIEIFYPRDKDDNQMKDDILNFTTSMFNKLNIKISIKDIKRGLTYYDDLGFEVFIDNEKLALAGGGKYNKLLDKFDRSDLSGIGIAGGVERIMANLP